jgi:hypothetical protein
VEICRGWTHALDEFRRVRGKFLLYP